MREQHRLGLGFSVLSMATSNYAQEMSFFDLVKKGTPADVQAAIYTGTDVNASDMIGVTPLMYASESNENLQVIAMLIDAGADVNATDDVGTTALMYAANGNENPEVIAMLLKAGTTVNVTDTAGSTPLMFAAQFNKNPEVINMLLNNGADAKAKNSHGKTALHLAKKNHALRRTGALKQLKAASR
jgi:ankyrin repeat protein